MGYWRQLEPTEVHLAYLILSSFLIIYALTSLFIRNNLHLSEPPLATLFGILFGPKCAGLIDPLRWGLTDPFTQEFTRVVLGVQCFAVGVELPKYYVTKHWKSVGMLLGPVMAFGWLICGLFIHLIFDVGFPTALVISACLTPTDPVLAASVLSNSQFSDRIPARLRHMLSAESGSNDGVSFPFLYIGLSVLTRATLGGMLKKWFLITILWQYTFGIFLGLVIGFSANRLLRFSYRKEIIGQASYIVFYLLLAIFCVGTASTLGVDDFLLAFSAGVAFARDGWFADQTAESRLPNIIDFQLNSGMFVYFGATIPWSSFTGTSTGLTMPRLLLMLLLILLFRRIPAVLATKRLIPSIHTYREALFAGHFGPMGVGALFLAIEARAQLENDTSIPEPSPPTDLPPERQRAVDMLWPVVTFVVLGSTMVHGLSVLAISVGSHFSREKGERTPLIGGETGRFNGMDGDGAGSSEDEDGEA